eukprot:1391334-Prymnesium_polylepis.2
MRRRSITEQRGAHTGALDQLCGWYFEHRPLNPTLNAEGPPCTAECAVVTQGVRRGVPLSPLHVAFARTQEGDRPQSEGKTRHARREHAIKDAPKDGNVSR